MEAGRVASSGTYVIAENWLSFRNPHSAIDGHRKRSLFEAEITGPAGSRGTDNHVIQHLYLQEPRVSEKQQMLRFRFRVLTPTTNRPDRLTVRYVGRTP